MKLLPANIRSQIPPLYSTENDPDPLVRCKFFAPWSTWTWYVTEFDGVDTLFGWVDGDFPELGYFSLSELESVRGLLGLRIERDIGFEPCKLSVVKEQSVRV